MIKQAVRKDLERHIDHLGKEMHDHAQAGDSHGEWRVLRSILKLGKSAFLLNAEGDPIETAQEEAEAVMLILPTPRMPRLSTLRP